MKITCNKKEFAALVMGCVKFAECEKCALVEHCKIDDESDYDRVMMLAETCEIKEPEGD